MPSERDDGSDARLHAIVWPGHAMAEGEDEMMAMPSHILGD